MTPQPPELPEPKECTITVRLPRVVVVLKNVDVEVDVIKYEDGNVEILDVDLADELLASCRVLDTVEDSAMIAAKEAASKRFIDQTVTGIWEE